MKIYDLQNFVTVENNLDMLSKNITDKFFIVLDWSETTLISKNFNFLNLKIDETDNIKFESHEEFDFISFEYFEIIDSKIIFEKFNLIYSENLCILINDEKSPLKKLFIKKIESFIFSKKYEKNDIVQIYYSLLNNIFSEAFSCLNHFETILEKIELDIITKNKEYSIEYIVSVKKDCFRMKKAIAAMLYIGDQLVINDNKLIPEKKIKYFRNLDMQINRLYKISVSLNDFSEHLMSLYDTAISSKTNDMLNKLTVFTVFATPISILTGVYGMNFVNMPELQHKNGYFILLLVMFFIILSTYLILKKIKLI